MATLLQAKSADKELVANCTTPGTSSAPFEEDQYEQKRNNSGNNWQSLRENINCIRHRSASGNLELASAVRGLTALRKEIGKKDRNDGDWESC